MFWNRYVEPDRFYENDGGGRMTAIGNLGGMRVSRGLLAFDLDGDGDEDVAVSYADGSIGLFENRVTERPSSWKITAIDGGAVALGARLEWIDGYGPQVFVVATVRGYQSSGDATVTVASSETPPDSVTVVWTDGSRERFPWPGPAADGVRRLERGDGTLEASP